MIEKVKGSKIKTFMNAEIVEIQGKDKGAAENERPPVDVKSLLP